MDVYTNLVCNDCGMPLNDAVLAGCGSFLCCSALWSNVPGMVCPISERPLFCFKNHFYPGGNHDMNLFKHNEKEVNSTGLFLASGNGSKHLGRHDRSTSKVESSSGQDGPCSQGIDCDKLQGNIEDCSNGKIENEAEGLSFRKDSNGAQTPCSTNEGREVSGQANDALHKVNRALFQSLEPSDDTLRSDNLKRLDRILSSSRVDGNRNAQKQSTKLNVEIISSEKDIACGTSVRTPDMNFTYIKMLESRLADLENKVVLQDSTCQDCQRLEKVVAQHDSLLRENRCYRHYFEINVNQQRDALRQLQADCIELKLKYEILDEKFVQAQVKIDRLLESSRQVHQELSALHQKADFNKQRIERLVRRLDNMNEKIAAYVSLLCGVDIQSVA